MSRMSWELNRSVITINKNNENFRNGDSDVNYDKHYINNKNIIINSSSGNSDIHDDISDLPPPKGNYFIRVSHRFSFVQLRHLAFLHPKRRLLSHFSCRSIIQFVDVIGI